MRRLQKGNTPHASLTTASSLFLLPSTSSTSLVDAAGKSMPPTTNARRYRRPEIGEASGSNSRVSARPQDMTGRTDGQVTSSTASSPTPSALKSPPFVDRAKPIGPGLSLLPLGRASGDGASGKGLSRQSPLEYTPLHAPLGDITEDDEMQEEEEAREQVSLPSRTAPFDNANPQNVLVDGLVVNGNSDETLSEDTLTEASIPHEQRYVPLSNTSTDDQQREGEEADDQFAPFLIPAPSMDIEDDEKIISEVCFDGDPSEGLEMGSRDETSTPPAPRQGVPLRRTNTITSIGVSLRRTFTTESNLTVALRNAPGLKYKCTLAELCDKIKNSVSLPTAEIIKVDRYRQETIIGHRFLVLQLRRKGKYQDVFLRLDRLVDPRYNRGLKFVWGSSTAPAYDWALLAADEGRAVRGDTPVDVEIVHEARLEFPNPPIRPPTLTDLRYVLNAIALNMKKYRLLRENCWLFCAVCLEGLMKRFGGTFMRGGLVHVSLRAIFNTAARLRASIHARVFEFVEHKLLCTILTPFDVYSIAVSPDGNHIVSGHDGSVRLWDAQTGAAVGEALKGYPGGVRSVAFSPNGRWIVSGSSDATIRLWDMETRTAAGESLRGHGGTVWSVAFSPDGERIVSGSWDNTIRLWDRATGTAIGEPLKGHGGGVKCVAFSPDGRTIASGSDDRTICLWDATTGSRKPLTGHTDWVWSVAFTPNGQHIASCSFDNTVRIWDTATGVQIGEALKGHTDWVMSVVYSPDGRYIASGSYDGTILFWDAMTGSSIGAKSICFYPDGRRIASCGGWRDSDNTIRIWEVPI